MIDINLKNLQQFLVSKGLEANIQEETKQVYVVLKEDNKELPAFFRVFEKSDLLQIICFFPFQIPKKQLSEMARLLHLLNKELDVPGFGMDELSFVAFFRVMVHTPEGKVDEGALEKHINTVKLAAKTFTPSLEAVASGAITIDQMIAKASANQPQIKP